MDELAGIRQRKKQRENESMAAPLVGGAMAAPPPAPSSSASSTSAVARVAPLGPPPAICTGVGGAGTGRARSPPPTPKVAHVLLVDLGGTNARFDLRKVSVHVLVARLRKRLRTPRSAAAAAAASSASANPTPYGKRGAGSGEGEEDDEEDEQVCAVTYPTVEEKEGANELVDGRGSRFEGMISRFLAEDGVGGITPDLCVAGVCGPVMDGAAYCASQRMMETTGPWHFDEASVSTMMPPAKTSAPTNKQILPSTPHRVSFPELSTNPPAASTPPMNTPTAGSGTRAKRLPATAITPKAIRIFSAKDDVPVELNANRRSCSSWEILPSSSNLVRSSVT